MRRRHFALPVLLAAWVISGSVSGCSRSHKTSYTRTAHLDDVEITRVFEAAENGDVMVGLTATIGGTLYTLKSLSRDQDLAFLRGDGGSVLMYLPTGRRLQVTTTGELLSEAGASPTTSQLQDMLAFERLGILLYRPEPRSQMTLIDTKKQEFDEISIDPPFDNPMHVLTQDEEAAFRGHVHGLK